eukprot:Rhum_TRINITY_DN23440_c0_g1::Rhum_TRINITY_DN23440_c0_g1_i1::g.177912::m.177912
MHRVAAACARQATAAACGGSSSFGAALVQVQRRHCSQKRRLTAAVASARTEVAGQISNATPGAATAAATSTPAPSSSSSASSPEAAAYAMSERKALALQDTFNRFHDYLRISITERCNLRCQYCMPKEGIDLTEDEKLMSTEEIVRSARLFTELGVKKIRLTGGEPLIRKDVDFLLSKLGDLREKGLEKLCITTNGINLSKKIPVLKKSGVKYINISLDTLEEHKFEFVTRRRGYAKVMRSLHDCIADDFFVTKVNCVVMKGINDEEVAAFARLAQEHPIEVRFIEYMPFGGNDYKTNLLVPWMETYDSIESGLGCKLAPIPGKRGDVSKRFRADGWKGSVGFITTMTAKFCASCNRIRLLADGQLKVCLHDGHEGSLLEPMRVGASDDDLAQTISGIILQKKEALGGNTEETLAANSDSNRPMIKIGG